LERHKDKPGPLANGPADEEAREEGMTRAARGLAFGSVLVLGAGLLSARAQDLRGVGKDVADLAREAEAGTDVSKKAAALAKRYARTGAVMRVYSPRARGGIGFGPRGEGIEYKFLDLGERPLSAAALKKESPDLLQLAHVNMVVAEVLRGHAPEKPVAGRGKKEWVRDLEGLKRGSQALLQAVKAGDPKAVQVAAVRINGACNSCHGFPSTP
jgi:hypothetical protein